MSDLSDGGATASVALVSHPACALHDTGWQHPEHQGRLPAITRGIYGQTPELLDRWLQAEAPPADRAAVLRVHTEAHLGTVRDAVERAESAGRPIPLTADTVVSGASWEAALAAAGVAVHGARLVVEGDAATSFALTRPPGHHATAGRAMGFCLFNNVAVAARWAQAEAGVERVLIVDWDVHHGNGTQDIFYDDPSVFYLSFHLGDHYPGTGRTEQRGTGPGEGTTRNHPFPRGTGAAEYLEVYEEAVTETVEAFEPQLVLVSAGFDCLSGDPLGGLPLEPADLHTMTRHLADAVARMGATDGPDEVDGVDGVGGGRIAGVVVALEGGYVPSRAADGAVQVVRALAGLPPVSD